MAGGNNIRTKQEVSKRTKAGWSGFFWKYKEILLDRHLPMSLKRKVCKCNQCVLPAMTCGCQTMKHGLSQKQQQRNLKQANKPWWKGKCYNQAERQNLKHYHEAKNQSDRHSSIPNQCKMEMDWIHCPNERQQMGDQKHRVADKGHKISWKTKTLMDRWYCGATGSNMDKDSKGQRKLALEDSAGRLLPAAEAHLEMELELKENLIVIRLCVTNEQKCKLKIHVNLRCPPYSLKSNHQTNGLRDCVMSPVLVEHCTTTTRVLTVWKLD